LTETVRSLYEAFPFPNTEYQLPIRAFAEYFARRARKGGRSLLKEGVEVVDAGCGTAAFITQLATAFPESRFTGVDMTSASLAVARRQAVDRNLSNLSFVQADLLTLALERKFDVVMNLGVLHHLADPDRGLERLAAHLAEDGYLVLWLYGTHGRYRLNLNQRAFHLLFKSDEGWQERVALAKRALTGFSDDHLQCHFSVADQRIENDFSKARAWILEHDQWIADQFVHPAERTVDLDEIVRLLGRQGLVLDTWLGISNDPESYTADETLRARMAGLPRADLLRFIDLLIKPNYYFVVARRA
jgi:SAM-dependent methyltransferase